MLPGRRLAPYHQADAGNGLDVFGHLAGDGNRLTIGQGGQQLGFNLDDVLVPRAAVGPLPDDDPFAEPLFPSLPDLDLVVDELCYAIEQLRRFEVALLSHRSDPYR